MVEHMRYALVIIGDIASSTGGFLYDRVIARSLASSGDEIEVISIPCRDGFEPAREDAASIVVERVRGTSPDLLIEDELAHRVLLGANEALRRGGPPVVSIVHHLARSEETVPGRPAGRDDVELLYLESVDGFVVNSEATFASIRDLTGRSFPHVLARPGCDRLGAMTLHEVDERLGRRAGRLKILFAGQIVPRKRLHTLLEAIGLAGPDRFSLHVAGDRSTDPAYSAAVLERAGRLGPGGSVTFHGAVSDRSLAGLMRECDLLAVPSRYEGYGIVYSEGMGFGLPALGSPNGGACEIIEDGINGFLPDPDDPGGLASVLDRLASEDGMLERMSVEAWKRSRSLPSWKDTCAEVSSFLDHMTTRSGPGPL